MLAEQFTTQPPAVLESTSPGGGVEGTALPNDEAIRKLMVLVEQLITQQEQTETRLTQMEAQNDCYQPMLRLVWDGLNLLQQAVDNLAYSAFDVKNNRVYLKNIANVGDAIEKMRELLYKMTKH